MWPVRPLHTLLYVGAVSCPAVYPTLVLLTPGTRWKASSTPQKHPPMPVQMQHQPAWTAVQWTSVCSMQLSEPTGLPASPEGTGQAGGPWHCVYINAVLPGLPNLPGLDAVPNVEPWPVLVPPRRDITKGYTCKCGYVLASRGSCRCNLA